MSQEDKMILATLLQDQAFAAPIQTAANFFSEGSISSLVLAAKQYVSGTNTKDANMGPDRYANYRIGSTLPFGPISISFDEHKNNGFTVSVKTETDEPGFQLTIEQKESFIKWFTTPTMRKNGYTLSGFDVFNLRNVFIEIFMGDDVKAIQSIVDTINASGFSLSYTHRSNKTGDITGFTLDINEPFYLSKDGMIGETQFANGLVITHRMVFTTDVNTMAEHCTYSLHGTFLTKEKIVPENFCEYGYLQLLHEHARNGTLAKFVENMDCNLYKGNSSQVIIGRVSNPIITLTLGSDTIVEYNSHKLNKGLLEDFISTYTIKDVVAFAKNSLNFNDPDIVMTPSSVAICDKWCSIELVNEHNPHVNPGTYITFIQ
jgi:hypothetical protein